MGKLQTLPDLPDRVDNSSLSLAFCLLTIGCCFTVAAGIMAALSMQRQATDVEGFR